MLAVADGLGGHRGGSVAAQCAIDAIRHRFDQAGHTAADPLSFTRELVEYADAEVRRATTESAELQNMRTTIVLLYAVGGRASWCHVGDSRLLRFRGGALVQRTRDDSVVEMLFAMGKITEDEMRTRPERSRLARSLGDTEPVEARSREVAFPLEAGDRFLLCSDGVWEHLPRAQIQALSIGSADEAVFLDALFDALQPHLIGDADNATAVIADVQPGSTGTRR